MCIIDLDTIMPGLAANDFGDSIRFGASTAEEDERDLDKVHFDINLYELYVKGYLEMAKDVLTPAENASLPWGSETYDAGMRYAFFLLTSSRAMYISKQLIRNTILFGQEHSSGL